MPSRLRAALWAVAIGAMAVALAVALFRMIPGGGVVFVALLVLCVAFLSAVVGAIAKIPAGAGAGAGAFAATLVAAVLGLTISLAPLQPGARRPGFADLLWAPLAALVAAVALCAAAGGFGARTGVRFAHRRDRRRAPPPA